MSTNNHAPYVDKQVVYADAVRSSDGSDIVITGNYERVQSVTLTVLEGDEVSVVTASSSTQVPTGMSMTWSVAKDQDAVLEGEGGSLAFAPFTANPTDFIVHVTYLGP